MAIHKANLLIDKYEKEEPITRRIRAKRNMKVRKTFDVSGKFKVKKRLDLKLKNGDRQALEWDVDIFPARTIRAKSKDEAKQEFIRIETELLENDDRYEYDVVDVDILNVNVNDMNNIQSSNIEDTMMRSAKYAKYDFISSDDKYLQNTGYCVRDCFVGKYSEKIKKLNNNLFDILCYESLGQSPPLDTTFEEDVIDMYSEPNWKQDVLNDDTLTQQEKDELINNYREPKWNPSSGVSPKMLNYICVKLTKMFLKLYYKK